MNIIELSQHTSNADPTAELVSSNRESFSVFKVRGGFVAAASGKALAGLFSTKEEAERAAKTLVQ